MIGSWNETLFAFVVAIVGVKLLSYGTEGWFVGQEINIFPRILLSISGILVISGNLRNVGISILVIAILLAYDRLIGLEKSNKEVWSTNKLNRR